MKGVVFGGSGFVGSPVADALTEAGHEVVVFDINPSPHLGPDQRFEQGDILDFDSVRKTVDGMDVVYNFAGMADIDTAQHKPVETVRVNILGNANILEASKEAGAGRYVFASTVYVYSDSGGFYRTSKQACELYIEEYERHFGLNYTILRYGSLYGRRADSTNSMRTYLAQALKERRIEEYIHVQDAARLSGEILAEEYRNQHVILTGHHSMKFSDMLTMIREIVGSDVEIVLRPPETHSDLLESELHYDITPYTFQPKLGRKLVNHLYIDMGQGLLDCLQEISEENSAGGK